MSFERVRFGTISMGVASIVLMATLVSAQAPPPPPSVWTGNVGAGLTVTTGNSDTQQYNVGGEFQIKPNDRSTTKLTGAFLRGTNAGTLNVNRTNLEGREEYRFNSRTFLFGQLGYLFDEFKQVDYLVAPLGGVGYQAYKTDNVLLQLDGGAGGVWEKNPGSAVRSSGALTAGESYNQKISEATSIVQVTRGLWKTNDYDDALYTFSIGMTTAIRGSVQFKVEFQDTYKNKPPDGSKKNDTSVVLSIVYKLR